LLVRLAAVAVAAAAAVAAVVAVAAAAVAAEGAGRRADRTCLLRRLSCKASLQQLGAPQCGRCVVWAVAAVSAGAAGAGGEEGIAGGPRSGRRPGGAARRGPAGRASR